jgi:hypothetical protein
MSCSTGKQVYASPQQAAAEARKINSRRRHFHRKNYGNLRPYHCTECKQWHLTKMNRSAFT